MKRDWFALAFAVSAPSLMTWVEFAVLGEGERADPLLQWLFAVGKVLQFAFPFLYVLLVEPSYFRWAKPTTRGLGLGFAMGLIVGAGALGLHFIWLKHTPLYEQTTPKLYRWLTDYNLASPHGYIIMALLMAVLHAFLEEYYWRWFVFAWLRRYFDKGPAILMSSLGFMAHHVVILSIYLPGYFWLGVLPFSLCVAVGGAIWAWLYERSQSLYCVWLSHGLVDLALMAVGFDLLSEYWSG